MKNRRPNILIITADTLRHDAIGICNPIVRTPNIDGLAAGGAAFTRAYCAAPECAPSRAAMLTGLPPHRNGVYANCRITLDGTYHADQPYVLNSGIPTLADMLAEHGYRDLLLPDTKYNCVVVDEKFRRFLKEHGFGNVHAPWGSDEAGLWYLPQPSPLPQELHLSHWTADLVIRRLESWLQALPGPFLMEFTFNKPHPPFDPPHPYDVMYNPTQVAPPIKGANYAPEQWPFYHLWQNSYKAPWGQTPSFIGRMQRAAYYGSLSFVDAQVGRILEFLARHGLRDNTIVVVTGDHGCMLGDHYLYGKRSWYDGASRVPLIISAPDGLAGGRRNDDIVSHLDVLPTLLDLAGIPYKRASFPGMSLVDLVNKRAPARELLIGQYGEKEMAVYMCMDRRYKYVYAAADEYEMLFDHVNDPHESQNLALAPQNAATQAHLREALIAYFRNQEYVDPIDGNDFRRFPLPPSYAATRRRCLATAQQG
ncbi:MAG: sulfatase-like hydrolase/transferase [Lentisphaerae bacterium]|nr:sulfatase-like hydrolase/transferase [Lentisphaerota bacterium]